MEISRIIINGASGTGKTTLAGEAAKRMGFTHLDLDDYYWTHEHGNPFSSPRPRDEVLAMTKADVAKHSRFVMSGTIGSILWDFTMPLFDLAVILYVPPEIRLERIKARAYARYGDRVLAGGDLYENHKKFYAENSLYETAQPPAVCQKRHELWASQLSCPILHLDGTKTTPELTELIINHPLLLAKTYK